MLWYAVFTRTRTVSEGPKVLKMIDFELIRRLVLVEGLSQREVAKKLNKSRRSIQIALLNSEPGSYTRSSPKKRPRTDAVLPVVKAWLEQDKTAPRKQRHSAVRIFERLRDEYDFKGSRRAVSNLVRMLARIANLLSCVPI